MAKEIIVSNDCCDYKLDGNSLLYNDERGTNGQYNEWGEVQIFEHFSRGDIQYLNKKFGVDVWVGCSQFGDCTEELIDTYDLVEFAKERLTNETH